MNQIIELSNEQLIRKAPSIGATVAHSAVSERYSFVPTVNAVNYLRDCGWLPVLAGESRANKEDRRGFQKHMIRFTRPDLLVNGNRMDLLLYNSHDRGCAFKLIGGVFRFVCSNGMVVGDRMLEFSHKHIGFNPDAFVSSANEINTRMGDIAGVIDQWQTIELTPDESGAYAIAAHQVVYGAPEPGTDDHSPIVPSQLLQSRRSVDNGNDLWRTFNRVQENATKGGLRGFTPKGRRAKTRQVKSIDRDRKLNQALWTLTQKMAELKNQD